MLPGVVRGRRRSAGRTTPVTAAPLTSARVLYRFCKRVPDHIGCDAVTEREVRQFLAHLEEERGCSVQTRNQRLTAIRSFARFVSSRDPTHLDWCAQLHAIATKKAMPRPISWITRDEMEALLAVPDRRAPRGRAEHALLLFFYNTGARVSEATRLQVGDLEFGRRDGGHALVTLCGKGGKIRQCPLWPRTENALGELVHRRTDNDDVFISRHRRPYTRFGVYRLVERCAAHVPSLADRAITPHVVRHSSACHLLQAGVDLDPS